MKIKSLTASALLLVAGLSSAQATVLTYATGDLFVGFRASGDNDNLEVNLGSAANYKTGSGLVDLSTRVTAADLTAAYGTDWATLGDSLKFGTFAANSRAATTAGEVKSTLWLGSEREDVAVMSVAQNKQSATNQNNAILNMEGFNGTTALSQSFKNKQSTSNSDFAFIADGTLAGSYNQQAKTSLYFNGNGLSGAVSEQEAVASIGSAWSLLDLYLVNPGTSGTPGTYLGTFGLALSDTTIGAQSFSAGSFVYQFGGADSFAVAIPEPSTYAIILGALTVGFVALRRRFSKAV